MYIPLMGFYGMVLLSVEFGCVPLLLQCLSLLVT